MGPQDLLPHGRRLDLGPGLLPTLPSEPGGLRLRQAWPSARFHRMPPVALDGRAWSCGCRDRGLLNISAVLAHRLGARDLRHGDPHGHPATCAPRLPLRRCGNKGPEGHPVRSCPRVSAPGPLLCPLPAPLVLGDPAGEGGAGFQLLLISGSVESPPRWVPRHHTPSHAAGRVGQNATTSRPLWVPSAFAGAPGAPPPPAPPRGHRSGLRGSPSVLCSLNSK